MNGNPLEVMPFLGSFSRGGNGLLHVAQIVITDAEMKMINTTPATIVPKIPGKVIAPIASYWFGQIVNYGGIAVTGIVEWRGSTDQIFSGTAFSNSGVVRQFVEAVQSKNIAVNNFSWTSRDLIFRGSANADATYQTNGGFLVAVAYVVLDGVNL